MSVYALKDTDWSWDDADEGRPVIVIADTPEDAVRIATEKHIRDCPGSGGVTWDIARLNLVAFGDAEWGSDNTPNFEPLTYYDEGVNGLPDTPPDASAIREAEPCQFLPTEDGEFNGNTFSDEPVPFGWITQRAYDHAYTTSDPVQVTILRTESGPGLMPRVPLYTTPPDASAIREALNTAIYRLCLIENKQALNEGEKALVREWIAEARTALAGAKP